MWPTIKRPASTCLALTLGPGPLSGASIGRTCGVGALWDCVPRVCGGGGGVVPLWAGPARSGFGGVFRGGTHIIIIEGGSTQILILDPAAWLESKVRVLQFAVCFGVLG